MESKINCSSRNRKGIRRRSHTRKTAQLSVINMAEARREIAHALHLHRSNYNYYSISTPPANISSFVTPQTHIITTTTTSTTQEEQLQPQPQPQPGMLASNYILPPLPFSCYSLVEAMPPMPAAVLPAAAVSTEPLWSTTAPSLPTLEAMESPISLDQWPQAAAAAASASASASTSSSPYSCWLANFLRALDDIGNNNIIEPTINSAHNLNNNK